MRTKTENLSLRVAPEIRAGLEAAAAHARRPISNLVTGILQDWLAARAAILAATVPRAVIEGGADARQ